MNSLGDLLIIYALVGGMLLPLVASMVGFSKERLTLCIACVACAISCFAVLDSFGYSSALISIGLPDRFLFGLILITPILSITMSVVTFKVESKKVEERNLKAAADRRIDEGEMENCSYCAESIQQDAIYCRRCGEETSE